MQQHKRFGFTNTEGVALVEFAFVLPILFLLVFGAIEVTRYILILQKMENASYVMTDMIAQLRPAKRTPQVGDISVDEVTRVFNLYDRLMAPYNVPARQAVVVASVMGNQVCWQRSGGGALAVTSTISGFSTAAGTTNTSHTGVVPFRPALWTPQQRALIAQVPSWWNKTVLVGEFFYQYQPIVGSLLNITGFGLGPRQLRRVVYFYPRNVGAQEEIFSTINSDALAGLYFLPPDNPVITVGIAGCGQLT